MPGRSRAFFVGWISTRSIQRKTRGVAAHVRRRVQRLAIDRAVVVLARERRIAEFRREGVVLEFAVAGQHFGAGIEPGAGGDVDARMGSLLIDLVRAAIAVIGPAVPVVLLLRWRALGFGLRLG